MTGEEAEAILGPEVVASIRADVDTWPPLTDEQIALAVRVLMSVDVGGATRRP